MGQLLCSVNLSLVLLKWEAKWACVLAFLPSFIKTVGGDGKWRKNISKIFFFYVAFKTISKNAKTVKTYQMGSRSLSISHPAQS